MNKNKYISTSSEYEVMNEKKNMINARNDIESNVYEKEKQPESSFRAGEFLWKSLPYFFGLITLLAIIAGFRLREFEYFTAEEGTGYALGIIGGSMMLALLLYPLRKRIPILRIIGNVRVWFAIHMMLGIMGPLLILYHANFSLGSTNSNVALFCMLIVSGSGIIGRYIYTKIHHGLYGKKISLARLKENLNKNQQELMVLLHLNPEAKEAFFTFVDKVLMPTKGLYHSWTKVMTAGIGSRILLRKIRKLVQNDLARNTVLSRKERGLQVKMTLREADRFLQHSRKLAEFNFYERMFALWHVLHLPLFFMLVMAAFAHVFAVHWY